VFASAKIPRCFVATSNAYERRSDAAHDRRPLTTENENGMNAAGSVMKAAGKWMKRSYTVCAGRFRNDMNGTTAPAIPFAIPLPAVMRLPALPSVTADRTEVCATFRDERD
jgi:hypothetical protein